MAVKVFAVPVAVASGSISSASNPGTSALRKLGGDIQVARKRRRLAMTIVAKRAFISRNTLTRVERGDPTPALRSPTSRQCRIRDRHMPK